MTLPRFSSILCESYLSVDGLYELEFVNYSNDLNEISIFGPGCTFIQDNAIPLNFMQFAPLISRLTKERLICRDD